MKIKKLASIVLAAVLATATLAGCGSTPSGSSSASVGYPDEDGYAEGRLGDTMHSYFFNYTVNSAYVCDTYEGYAPADGNELLVANVTVKNTHSESIEMYDTDFQVQWNDDSEDAYGWPITINLQSGETVGKDMLPDVYTLAVNETRTGILVYEVPSGNKDFSISYKEYFDDDTTGDVFFVYFSADKQ